MNMHSTGEGSVLQLVEENESLDVITTLGKMGPLQGVV